MNNLYVIYGDEKFLIEKEIRTIINHHFGSNVENKISKYNLSDTTISTVIDDANMLSLFDDKKIIVCNDCFFLTGTSSDSNIEHDLEILERYINHPNENTILIMVADNTKLDERKKIVKNLQKNTIVKCFNKLKELDLVNYAKKRFTDNNYQVSSSAIRLLIDRVEDSLALLDQEIEKLMIYKIDDKSITEEDINILIRKPISDNVFELVDAVMKKDINKTLDIYHQLLIRNEEPIKVIAILANQFRLIYQTRKLFSMGYSEKDIASKLGIHPYRIKLANEIDFNEKILLTYLEKLADLDYEIKTGQISKDIGLELFFLQI